MTKKKKTLQPPKLPPHRPPKEIDWTLFEELCSLQCTQSEIASCLRVNTDTIRDRSQAHYKDSYSEVYKRFSETGKTSLRRYQFIHAKKNPGMAIYLGKVILGQRENDTVDVSIEVIEKYNDLCSRLIEEQKEHMIKPNCS